MRTEIELEAMDLPVGGSRGGLECPSCHGGRSGERKFSVTRTDSGVLYNCYRASCSFAGFLPLGGYASAPQGEVRAKKKVRHYDGELFPLDERDMEYFERRFGLTAATATMCIRTNERDEYVLPVNDWLDREAGYVVRANPWTGVPASPRKGAGAKMKSFSFQHSMTWPDLAVYRGDSNGVTVIVEDQLSAMKVAQNTGCDSVALLGTDLNVEKVRAIMQGKNDYTILALDSDASAKALYLARTWGMALGQCRVVLLERDLKDEDDICDVLGV